MIDKMPLEIIANIVSYMSMREALDMSHTCRSLRYMMTSGFTFDVADYAHDDIRMEYFFGITCRRRARYNRERKNPYIGESMIDTKGIERIAYPRCPSIDIHNIDVNRRVYLFLTSMNIRIKPYVSRIVLSSIPIALNARVDEIKITISTQADYSGVQWWSIWVAARRLIIVIKNTGKLHDLIDRARYVAKIAREYSSRIRIVVIVEYYMTEDAVYNLVRAFDDISIEKFKFRWGDSYSDLRKYRSIGGRMYIRRIVDHTQLIVIPNAKKYIC